MRVALLLALAALLASLTNSLTVHIVPHTHDDVGWLKTVDQYYVGLHNDIQHAMVQFVLDSVVSELNKNPNRTFVYVEQAFFQRWWRQQDDAMKTNVKALVKAKQLEFINGGWCMHDEATTHFVDMIDQTTLGHSYILREFGADALPTIGWQIDPFGHSATHASLLSGEVGFDGLFFGRIDHVDHDQRAQGKNLEFVWRASKSRASAGQVFAGAFQSGNYGPPDGLCWDYFCSDDPIQDDHRLNDYNLDRFVDLFIQRANEYAANTRGDTETMNIMWTMGSDFMHENSAEWMINLDKIVDAVNTNGTVKALYSTPSRYLKAKNTEPVQWTVKTDDFFPYSDGENGYWTGYFTSRAALKRYVRVTSNFLQIARHMELFTAGTGNWSEPLWESQSVAQHHDAVAGTEKQAVAFDYAQRLARGSIVADTMIEQSIATVLNMNGDRNNQPSYSYCPLANVTVCDASASGNVIVAVYNPLAHPRSEVVFIPSASNNVKVVDGNGKAVSYQVLATVKNAATQGSQPYRVAVEVEVPGLGFQTVFLLRSSDNEAETVTEAPVKPIRRFETYGKKSVSAAPSIENSILRLNFDSTTNLLVSITNKQTNTTTPFTQDFAYYQAYQKKNPNANYYDQLDGAYVFRPLNNFAIAYDGVMLVSTANGALVSEAVQSFGGYIFQVIRLKADSPIIEFEWTVGPIDITDGQGKEVVIRYNSTLQSKGQFFTDSNGREYQTRNRNQHPSWKWEGDQPIAGNYYPVNSAMWLTDNTNAFIVNVDRSQGGASIVDGELELMLHRRLTSDDEKGVGEPLNEPGLDGNGLIVTGTHYVFYSGMEDVLIAGRVIQSEVFGAVHISYAAFDGDVSTYTKSHHTSLSFVNASLPENVELVTAMVMPHSDGVAPAGSTLIRLAHMYGVDEPAPYSEAVTFDLATVIVSPIQSLTELSLTAVRPAGSHQQMQWNTTSDANGESMVSKPLFNTTITLQPLQIRTFAVMIGDQ